MTSPKSTVTAGGRERVASTAALYAEAFRSDPVITYMLHRMSPDARLSYLEQYFSRLLTAAAMNKALFHEIGEGGCYGVLMPPGSRVDNWLTMVPAGFLGMMWNIGLGSSKRMFDYGPITNAAKAKGLKGEKRFYYVFFMATREDVRGKGLCSAVMRKYQELGSRDGVPVWLEATTAKSMAIYRKLGWKVVDELVIGKGKVDPDGLSCEGGEGVKFWGMIWFPEGHQKVQKEGESTGLMFWLLAAAILIEAIMLYICVVQYIDIQSAWKAWRDWKSAHVGGQMLRGSTDEL